MPRRRWRGVSPAKIMNITPEEKRSRWKELVHKRDCKRKRLTYSEQKELAALSLQMVMLQRKTGFNPLGGHEAAREQPLTPQMQLL